MIRSAARLGLQLTARVVPKLRVHVAPTEVLTLRSLQQRGCLDSFDVVYNAREHQAHRPVSFESSLHPIFEEHLSWRQEEAIVATIPNGRVWGRRGCVLTSDNALVEDVSREFGAYKGLRGKDHSVCRRPWLPKLSFINETVAVIATPGSANYHHWTYDTLPRLHLMQKAGVDLSSCRIIVDYTGSSFQEESLSALGINPSNLICPPGQWNFHVRAKQLIVTTLPSELGTVSDRVYPFLRDTFLPQSGCPDVRSRRLYVSRQKAGSRKIRNQRQVEEFLWQMGFEEVFAEDLTVGEAARKFSEAEAVVSVHGSGLSNLSFANRGVKVVDLVPPRHLDSYYWLMTDHVGGKYAYLFGEGDRASGNVDLVREKVDEDIQVDVDKLRDVLAALDIRRERR